MSYLSFNPTSTASTAPVAGGTLRSAFSQWILANHGSDYREAVKAQRERPAADHFNEPLSSCSPTKPTETPLVGIVGGGFAGLYAGPILQSLGIEFELFESSDRVGGRIDTWYSKDYSSTHVDKAGLYGEVGGMRVPQYSFDMLPVQQLALSINAVLERNKQAHKKVQWRKFYYDSPVQRLRYNNMETFTTLQAGDPNVYNFGEDKGGDIPDVWLNSTKSSNGGSHQPINQVLGQVNKPFIAAINNSFAEGFALMMQYGQHSMWDYLTTVFTLGDLGEYYDPAMGAKSDFLPYSVASYLETTNVGTGMYSVSFVEMVIAVYDWGGSHNPYKPSDSAIYMITVDGGMQRFPDACHTVLNLEQGVMEEDGNLAQVQVGMLKGSDGKFSYTAPNIVPDNHLAEPDPDTDEGKPKTRQRVFLNHKAVELSHDADLFEGHGGMTVKIRKQEKGGKSAAVIEKQYPYVISTLPNGSYLNGELKSNLLNDLSFAKVQALRESNYMPAFKAFLTFKTQFWAELGQRQDSGLGVATTDRPIRQIVYPSYGYEAKEGVLQIYCWAEDARRLGVLSDKERVNECLKGIAYLYPDADVYKSFSGYHDGETTKTWFWDNYSGGGAFALFNPDQFKNLYPALLTPEFGGCLNIAGECGSVHHGWIVGAMDSAYNAVLHILQQGCVTDKIKKLQDTWGAFTPPDVAPDAATDTVLDYAYEYNHVDRDAASIAPHTTQSIYGGSSYEFNGNLPAFVADFSKVPQAMKKTVEDKAVLQMLNDEWDENEAMRRRAEAKASSIAPDNSSAVDLLEGIYYGDNFQTIPRPGFWLKDDDEFARQQLAGFMPNLLTRVSVKDVKALVKRADIPNMDDLGPLSQISFVADYRQYLEACTVTPVDFYLAQPLVFFTLSESDDLVPVGIQLEPGGELFTPTMRNAENAWLLAKMQTNCAGQSLHDVGFHQLYTHQICAMVSISLFSEEVFNPAGSPQSEFPFQEHPVFKLLRPHVVKTSEFQQTIYNRRYNPEAGTFPETREPKESPGVYNLGFVYDLIFSCGRIGNYQLQDKMYNNDGKFRFLDMAIPRDAEARGVVETPFSYAYVHDATHWYEAISKFIGKFVEAVYSGDNLAVKNDVQLQRFFSKLIPAFNHVVGAKSRAQRFPDRVVTIEQLEEVLTMFVWQFSVQHTVINDGAYNQAAFVPNASTLMLPLPDKKSSAWTPEDVLACLPPEDKTYPQLGNMTFKDVQINASVTGQGPYSETMLGRGLLEPSIDNLQNSYAFGNDKLREVVDGFYRDIRDVGEAIRQRQGRDIAGYYARHPASESVPETVVFDLLNPVKVMNTIQT